MKLLFFFILLILSLILKMKNRTKCAKQSNAQWVNVYQRFYWARRARNDRDRLIRDREDAEVVGEEGLSAERRCSPPETGGTLQWGGFNCRNDDR